MTHHPMNIANPNFKYVPANKTNVMNTLRAHGFTPPSEIPNYFEDKRRALLEDMSYATYEIEERPPF